MPVVMVTRKWPHFYIIYNKGLWQMPSHLIFQLGPPQLFQQLQARTKTPLAWQAQSPPSSVGAQQGCTKHGGLSFST